MANSFRVRHADRMVVKPIPERVVVQPLLNQAPENA